MRGPERRPFVRRLRDAVFAEVRDPGGDQRLDLCDAALLGHGDQRDVVRLRAAPTWPRARSGRGHRQGGLRRRSCRRAIGSGMAANQPPWPRDWLMTDERMGERLWEAIGRVAGRRGWNCLPPLLARAAERCELGQAGGRAWRMSGSWCWRSPRDARLAERLGAQLVHNPAGEPADLPFSLVGPRRARSASGACRRERRWSSFPRSSRRARIPDAPALGRTRGRLATLPAVRRLRWAG